jgi:hypothetical protein
MESAEDTSQVINRLKKRLEHVFTENFKAGTDVEPLVLEILLALKKYECKRG